MTTCVKLVLIEPLGSHPDIAKWFSVVGCAYFLTLSKNFVIECMNFSEVAAL
jgi:hypothetical protein